MKRILFLICFVFGAISIYAQKQWTLEDCLRYAQDNNITIKKAFLNTEISKQNHFQSKMALLPSRHMVHLILYGPLPTPSSHK